MRVTARASKRLVDYGFRLPSAMDNRPLNFDEFELAPEPGDFHQRHTGTI